MKNMFIVIPTLNPNVDLLEKFINELKKDFKNIVIVNDGCRIEYNDFFENMEKEGIIILKHCVNLGKGRALKTAFNYLLNTYPDIDGVVTADSDGQHSIKDIKKCADLVKKHPDSLILGSRDFNNRNVPKRSRFGNKLTRNVLKSMVGITLQDTQTGLRGLSRELMLKFVTTDGERFEYETKQLIDTAYYKIPIIEYKIDTIYINNNAESHFKTITDSIRVYKTFSKFFSYTISYWIIDILLFLILNHFINSANAILISTIISRIISSIYKYAVKDRLIYKKFKQKLSFGVMVFIQMILSGAIVQLIMASFTNASVFWIKVIIDIVIYFITTLFLNGFAFGGIKDEKE